MFLARKCSTLLNNYMNCCWHMFFIRVWFASIENLQILLLWYLSEIPPKMKTLLPTKPTQFFKIHHAFISFHFSVQIVLARSGDSLELNGYCAYANLLPENLLFQFILLFSLASPSLFLSFSLGLSGMNSTTRQMRWNCVFYPVRGNRNVQRNFHRNKWWRVVVVVFCVILENENIQSSVPFVGIALLGYFFIVFSFSASPSASRKRCLFPYRD